MKSWVREWREFWRGDWFFRLLNIIWFLAILLLVMPGLSAAVKVVIGVVGFVTFFSVMTAIHNWIIYRR